MCFIVNSLSCSHCTFTSLYDCCMLSYVSLCVSKGMFATCGMSSLEPKTLNGTKVELVERKQKVNNSPQLLTDFRKIFRGVTNSLKMNCYGIDFDKVAITRMKSKRAFNDDSHDIIITKIGQRTQEIQGFKCRICRYSSL